MKVRLKNTQRKCKKSQIKLKRRPYNIRLKNRYVALSLIYWFPEKTSSFCSKDFNSLNFNIINDLDQSVFDPQRSTSEKFIVFTVQSQKNQTHSNGFQLQELLSISMKENDTYNGEEDIKPHVTDEEVKNIFHENYGLKGGVITQLPGYDDLNYHIKPTTCWNPFIKDLWNYGYVLKIMNSLDSKETDLCEAQNALMLFLQKHNIPSPVPEKTMTGNYFIKQKFSSTPKTHIIRLLKYQPGNILKSQEKSYFLFYKLGVFLANINEALKEFSHPFYEKHSSIWHLSSVPKLKSMTGVIRIPERKQLVDKIIKIFTEDVVPIVDTFEKGMIHGDFNEHNVIVRKGPNEEEVFAILDFGDSHYSCYFFEMAIALCYMMIECRREKMNPLLGAGHLLAGYLSVRSKFPVNFGLLKLCICARICQSLILGLTAFSLHPENTYVMDSQENGWPLLEELWEISEEKITQEWVSVIESYKTENE